MGVAVGATDGPVGAGVQLHGAVALGGIGDEDVSFLETSSQWTV